VSTIGLFDLLQACVSYCGIYEQVFIVFLMTRMNIYIYIYE